MSLFGSSIVFCLSALSPVLSVRSAEDEEHSPKLILEGGLVDFTRDIQPIFAAKCISCHGPEDAKNDFRMDDSESVLSYLEPSDTESSSLWTDYLVTDDPEMRMPPPTAEGIVALTGSELAVIKLWIEEGAQWTESPLVEAEAETPAPLVPQSLAARIWIFQGLFHPATTHFPIALLTVSTLFLMLSFVRRDTCEPVAFHCLWIGGLGAILACAAGWSYAVYEGYGSGLSFDLQNSSIDRHRWLGIGVAVVSVALIPLAFAVRRRGNFGMRFSWLVGSLLMLVAVAIAGYQGGELTYGEDHYAQEFYRLFPEAQADAAVPAVEPANSTEEQPLELPEKSSALTESPTQESTVEEPVDEASPIEVSPDQPPTPPSEPSAESEQPEALPANGGDEPAAETAADNS
jgi:uncharacterized membrane protein